MSIEERLARLEAASAQQALALAAMAGINDEGHSRAIAALGVYRGVTWALECFGRAVAATAPNPGELLAKFEFACNVVDANMLTTAFNETSLETARKAFEDVRELLLRELRERTG